MRGALQRCRAPHGATAGCPMHCPIYLSTHVRPRGFTRLGQFRANDLRCVGWRRGWRGAPASGIRKDDMPAKMCHARDRHHPGGPRQPAAVCLGKRV